MNIETLVEKYKDFYIKNNFNIQPSVWNADTEYIKKTFNLNFRGENAYVWQEQMGDNQVTYQNYYKILKTIDTDNLFEKTIENGSFGCISYDIDYMKISRDLLDSILEIYFLKEFFPNLKNMNILEIGAGYGRLCKRFTDCYPNSNYFITDGIPQSTFFSNLYLGKNNRNVINLFDIQEKLRTTKIDIAINIHSFPECNIKDVEWWVKLIHANNVKYIFYVPNDPNSTPEYMPSNSKDSILEIFHKYNYKVKYYRNMFSELNIQYSYSVPFFLLENLF